MKRQEPSKSALFFLPEYIVIVSKTQLLIKMFEITHILVNCDRQQGPFLMEMYIVTFFKNFIYLVFELNYTSLL